MRKLRLLAKCKRGFTLVELLAVMAIMTIATAMILPNIRGMASKAEYRQYSSYCMTANTNVRNYVNLLNLGEETVTYEKDNKYYTYIIKNNISGLRNALNYYNMSTAYQYYVMPFDSSLSTNPSATIKDLISAGTLQSKDVMVVCITRKVDSKTKMEIYSLKGFWYYLYEKEAVVCSYKTAGGVTYEDFHKLG